MSFIQEFKKFAMRGNVIDLAIGVVLGVAFGKIVSSLVSDIILPPIGLLMGGLDFSNIFISLSGVDYPSLQAAKDAGAATINVGVFVNTLIDFLIIAFVIFLLVKQINRLMPAPVPVPVVTKDCPYCATAISIKASRCPHCTSQL